MYLLTIYPWSDAAMGDGNPRALASIHPHRRGCEETLLAYVIAQAEDEEIKTLEQAIQYLESAPETSDFDITEVIPGMPPVNLSRNRVRTFDGQEILGEDNDE